MRKSQDTILGPVKACGLYKRSALRMFLSATTWLVALGPAHADDPRGLPAPVFSSIDVNGVDLGSGRFPSSYEGPRIGTQNNDLGFDWVYLLETAPRHSLYGVLEQKPTSPAPFTNSYTAVFGMLTVEFLVPTATGVSVVMNGQGGEVLQGTTLIDRDGTRYVNTLPATSPTRWYTTEVVRPDGERLTFGYTSGTNSPILRTVHSTLGYGALLTYQPSGMTVTMFNQAVDYCAPSSISCTFTQSWPTATSVGGYTDALGRVTSITTVGTQQYRFQTPAQGGTTTGRTVTFGTSESSGNFSEGNQNYGRVITLTNQAGTWTYSWKRDKTITGDPNLWRYYVTRIDPEGRTMQAEAVGGTLVYMRDEIGRISRASTVANPPSPGRITSLTDPEGAVTTYSYDARGNITRVERAAKPGSGLANTVQTASFPATCTNQLTCNQPDYVIDERGGRTDYTYHAQSGQIATVTLPAGQNGVRPQTRYSYVQLQAVYKNASGQLVPSGAPVWRLSETSACQTAASCVGTADEVRTIYSYDGHLRPTSVTTQSGNAALAATVTNTYDSVGNVVLTDGPLAGSGDVTRRIYDLARQEIGVVAPDPDGAGPLIFRASRTVYSLDGRPTGQERGTTTNNGASALLTFSSLRNHRTSYNLWDQPIVEWIEGGGQTFSYKQFSYDGFGRQVCSVVRMNPPAFTATSNACAPGTAGAFGPDRIDRQTYDAVGRLLTRTTGYGTPQARVVLSQAWTPNDKVDWIEDALGNRSDYIYDGFDRLSQLRYPLPTVGSHAASTTDYEQYGYDAAANMVSFRNRAGETFAYGWDALGRKISVDAPGTAQDATYAFDNLGRQLTASAGGLTTQSGWDALSRKTSESGALGTVSYQYDAAGRRTRMTWPGSALYVTYDYDLADAVTAIRENGATSGAGVLATYSYDNLGNRLAVSRGNGVGSSYTHDSVSRLTGLTHDFAGTAQDLALTFAFNPDSQIVSRTASNSLYAITPGAGTTAYVNNGRNQITSLNASAVTYDGRANLTGVSGRTYGFNALNQMTSAQLPSGTTAFTYDPLERLYQLGGSATRRFLYDGPRPIAELDGASTVLNRFVPGAHLDETLVTYAGAGLTNRRWLVQDERSSVIALTDSGGVATTINRYDEFGAPAATNVGRQQYTGQVWLPEASVYHYKSRAYDPSLGRFLQTDRLGYEQGLNLYAYVGNDPINAQDPDGQACITANIASDYCRRSLLYQRFDRVFRDDTRFFAAASMTTAMLASMLIPLPWGQHIVSRETRDFMSGVSADLERLNVSMARQLETGAITGSNLDERFIRSEQSSVQQHLDGLRQRDPGTYNQVVSEVNRLLNPSGALAMGANAYASDRQYQNILRGVRADLGRDINFANQSDREAIAKALIAATRRYDFCRPTGNAVFRC